MSNRFASLPVEPDPDDSFSSSSSPPPLEPDYDIVSSQLYYLYTDGAVRGNPGGESGCGGVIYDNSHQTHVLKKYWHYIGFTETTSNVAEYKGLIEGLKVASRMGIKKLVIRMDSELVIKQMRKEYRTAASNLVPLQAEAEQLCKKFHSTTFEWVNRTSNTHADSLANQAIDEERRNNRIANGQQQQHEQKQNNSNSRNSSSSSSSSRAEQLLSDAARIANLRVTELESHIDNIISAINLCTEAQTICINDPSPSLSPSTSSSSSSPPALLPFSSPLHLHLLIRCLATLAEFKMKLAYLYCTAELWDLVFEGNYRSSILEIQQAQTLADEEFVKAVAEAEAAAVAVAEGSSSPIARSERFSELGQAISMILQKSVELKDVLESQHTKYKNRLQPMLEERDQVKIAIGEERWTHKPRGQKSTFAQRRAEIVAKLKAIENLQQQVEGYDEELNKLH